MADNDQELKKLKMACATVGTQYSEILVVAKTSDGSLVWHATDDTWALGACHRFITCNEETDRMVERGWFEGNGQSE